MCLCPHWFCIDDCRPEKLLVNYLRHPVPSSLPIFRLEYDKREDKEAYTRFLNSLRDQDKVRRHNTAKIKCDPASSLLWINSRDRPHERNPILLGLKSHPRCLCVCDESRRRRFVSRVATCTCCRPASTPRHPARSSAPSTTSPSGTPYAI